MKQKRHTTEEIIRILREADGGKDLEAVLRKHNISGASFYRWKKKFGGMDLKDARKYRQLEKEDAELKQMLADSLLKIRVLEEVNAKNGEPFAQAAGGAGRGGGRAVLAAKGLSLPGRPPLQPPPHPKQPFDWLLRRTPRLRRSPVSTLAWATASSCVSCAAKAGRWVASSSSASGANTACGSSGRPSDHDDEAAPQALSQPRRRQQTTSGLGTSSVIAPITVASCASSRCSTSTVGSASRSTSPAS